MPHLLILVTIIAGLHFTGYHYTGRTARDGGSLLEIARLLVDSGAETLISRQATKLTPTTDQFICYCYHGLADTLWDCNLSSLRSAPNPHQLFVGDKTCKPIPAK